LLLSLSKRWNEKAGYREVLIVAFPLILSTGSWSIQQFVDRMFLTWYSPESIAAAAPAGMLNFTVMSIFIGAAAYVSAFVAQYYGSGRKDRTGPSLWQGIYLSVFAGAIMIAVIPLAGIAFDFIGHESQVRSLEKDYFVVLCFGGFPAVASSAFSGFFSGRGETWPVMWINMTATVVNIFFDYLLIFGHLGFPEMGIKGAAWATVFSAISSFLIYFFLCTRHKYEAEYKTLSGWKFDAPLFRRLLKFGIPNGAHLFLDVAGFTIFLLLVGRLGTDFLAASNIATNINTLAFMPMIGLGIAITVLTGQYLGADNPEIAEKAAYSGLHLSLLYMTTIAFMFFFLPQIFLYPFGAGISSDDFSGIRSITVVLLKFVAVYSLFDSLTIVFSSAIKGAGDTKFVMLVMGVLSLLLLDIPSFVAFEIFGAGIYTGWTIASIYIILLGVVFYIRFKGGKWKKMRVIEKIPPSIPPNVPEIPLIDTCL
jgi:multidrug resistance protein, MATE family